MQHGPATACLLLNIFSIMGGIVVAFLSYRSINWPGGSPNNAASMLLLVGGIILMGQLMTTLISMLTAVRHNSEWSDGEKRIILITMPAGCLISMIAMNVGL